MSDINFTRLDNYTESVGIRNNDRIDEVFSLSQVELRHIQEEEEEFLEHSKENVLFDHFNSQKDGLFEFTGFDSKDLHVLYSYIEKAVNTSKRGRKTKFTPLDQFILFLHFLKSYPRLESMKPILHIEASTYQRIILKFLNEASPVLEDRLITKIAKECQIITKEDFPNAGYVVDATVQKINEPDLSWEISRQYFSGKHYIYCLKSQVIVTLQGLVVHIVSGIKGADHDKSIFNESIDDFLENTSRLEGENQIIADKGYVDSDTDVLITPVKGAYYTLSRDALLHNDKVSKIRIIIENFFGRLKCRYRIMSEQYRGSHGCYPAIFKTCCALVNFELISGSPLRDDDQEYFAKHQALLWKEASDEWEKRRTKSRKQKEKRKSRMEKESLLSQKKSSDDYDD